MKSKLILITITLGTVLVMSCGKKEEAPPPAGCPPQTMPSPYFGGCIGRAQCPQGLVQNPSQPTLCADPVTGNNVQQMQCGPGFVLTSVNGCVQQGPCPPGQGLVGDTCKQGVGGGYFPQQQMYMNTGGSLTGGAGWNTGAGWNGASPYSAYQTQSGWGMYPRYY